MSKEQNDNGILEIKPPRLLYNHLSTGDSKYHNPEKMPLVEYELWNHTRETITVTLTSEIIDYSPPLNNSPSLAPGEHVIYRQLPIFRSNTVSPLQENTPAVVSTCVSYQEAGKPLPQPIKEDLPLTLMPYNTILWAVPNPAKKGKRTFLLEHIVAWIIPGDDRVQEMLKEARESFPENYSGYPSSFGPDGSEIPGRVVEAIYNTLRKNKKLLYIDASKVASRLEKGEISQSVKRPGDTLKHGLGNCIDGAVLYASIIEAAGLDPVIVIQEDHAFVGWKTCKSSLWKKLGPTDKKYDFLETTWTLNSSKNFQQACDKGAELFAKIQEENWLRKNPFNREAFARLLDIRKLRAKLEREKTAAQPYQKIVIEEPASDNENESQAEKLNDILGNITQLPESDSGSDKSKQEHLLAASSYIIGVEQSLARIQSKISGNMTRNDCEYTINVLKLIHRPAFPAVENLFDGERQWAYRLDSLWRSVNRLKSSIDALRLRYTLANTSRSIAPLQPLESQRRLPEPDISALYRDLLQRTEKIAGDLKAAMMPEKTGTKKAEAD